MSVSRPFHPPRFRAAAIFTAALLPLLALAACSPSTSTTPSTIESLAPEGQGVEQTIDVDVDGTARSFELSVPPRTDDSPLPVIIALHQLGGSGGDFESFAGFSDRMASDGFLTIYPDGLATSDGTTVWNAGNCCNEIGAEKTDDIGFLSAILDQIPELGGDPSRVYLAGFSNGGMLSYRASCELADRISGLAVVSGAYNVAECPDTSPVPIIIVHGLLDDFIPYEGGISPDSVSEGLDPVVHPPVEETVQTWVERNQCTGTPAESTVGHATLLEYTDCADGASVSFYSVDGLYHEWPTDPEVLDVSEIIVDRFITGSAG